MSKSEKPDPYDTYLRGYSARTFETATDIDRHGSYAFALGAFHAKEGTAPFGRAYVVPIIEAAENPNARPVAKRRKAA